MKVCKRANCKNKMNAKGLCKSHYKKAAYKLNPNINKEYEKTPKGFLMRLYCNMKSRVSGVQKSKWHLYKGKYLLDKNEFYEWAENHPKFKSLFKSYKLNNHAIRYAPSVDRINPDLGYYLENMEWVTQSENSRRAVVTRKRLGV